MKFVVPGKKFESMAPMCTGKGDYVSIPVGGDGLMAIVDIEDRWLLQWRWSPWRGRRNLHYYPVRGIRIGKTVFQLHMSRFICGALPGERVSHHDRNSLNCRKTNLLLNGECLLDTDRSKITKENYEDYLSVYLS
ncbi:unnamed protein product [marine sediment metagenome]|uniref:HNH nuclease domain-containing protein n=1 Tax=marine sediment metagenome TaxID=412755 RepID=X0T733_9ZZZZ